VNLQGIIDQVDFLETLVTKIGMYVEPVEHRDDVFIGAPVLKTLKVITEARATVVLSLKYHNFTPGFSEVYGAG
jgi:hypothetical protein